jgi:hypothetical protein
VTGRDVVAAAAPPATLVAPTGPVVVVVPPGLVVLDPAGAAPANDAAATDVAGACGSDLVADFFSCMAAVTTGVPTAATGSLLPVAATSSPGMLPSHAIRLASANPRTNEITREVVSIA